MMPSDQHGVPKPRAAAVAIIRVVNRAAKAVRGFQREHTLAWELWWQAGRAGVPHTGTLRWLPTLDGPRLAGSHLPAADHEKTKGTVWPASDH